MKSLRPRLEAQKRWVWCTAWSSEYDKEASVLGDHSRSALALRCMNLDQRQTRLGRGHGEPTVLWLFEPTATVAAHVDDSRRHGACYRSAVAPGLTFCCRKRSGIRVPVSAASTPVAGAALQSAVGALGWRWPRLALPVSLADVHRRSLLSTRHYRDDAGIQAGVDRLRQRRSRRTVQRTHRHFSLSIHTKPKRRRVAIVQNAGAWAAIPDYDKAPGRNLLCAFSTFPRTLRPT